jgi:hypothetical protein
MKIFVGCSSEKLEIAGEIAAILEELQVTPLIWNEPGLFLPGLNILNRLIEIAEQEVDAAILIYSPDDKIWYGEGKLGQPRDNVIFEHGLFTGVLGPESAIIIKVGKGTKVATDFNGIEYIEYSNGKKIRGKRAITLWIQKLKNKSNSKESVFKIDNQKITVTRKDLIKEDLILEAGLKSFFPSRMYYPRFRDKIGSIDSYVNTAKNSLIMVSINLMTGLPMDGLCDVLEKRLVEEKKENFKATVSLLDPQEEHLMKSMAPIFNLECNKFSEMINEALSTLVIFRNKLPSKYRKNFRISAHKSIPFGSAIIIDHEKPYGKIQIETKPYKAPLQKSFAFEVIPTSDDGFYHTLVDGFIKLIDDGRVINNI